MNYTVVIPARFAASRLPGKPLLDIGGKPMLQHVYERACESSAARVLVATDDNRVAAVARDFGAEVVLTRADHPSGTDRIQEVVATLALDDGHIVVNVQGDEPLIPASVIDQVAANLDAVSSADIATLCEPIDSIEDMFNPNVVKVARDRDGLALYFSRAPIPWSRSEFDVGRLASKPAASGNVLAGDTENPAVPSSARRHLGIYAYRVSFLHRYVTWPPSDLESLESLEQLRALSNGVRIHVADAIARVPPGVDTMADLDHVRALMAGAAP